MILGLSFCVFAGCNVLTYTLDSLTYWLPDRIKNPQSIGFGKLFHHWVSEVLLKMHKKCIRFYIFLLFSIVSIESFQV